MFKNYKSKLGNQIQPVSKGTIEDYTETQIIYTKETTNVAAQPKKILFPEQHVYALVQLFKESIDSNTFEHMVAVGDDVGLGLFSFADVKKDPNSGLYLAYREPFMPFIGPQPEFYLGAFQNPCDYDEVFKKGVEDTISVNKYGFRVTKSTNGHKGLKKNGSTKTIDDLCLALANNPDSKELRWDKGA